MRLAALLVALIGCAAIIASGSRFLPAPRQATLALGVAADNLHALNAPPPLGVRLTAEIGKARAEVVAYGSAVVVTPSA